MDFQYRANPSRLLRRFEQFRSQLLRLRDYGRRYGWGVALATIAYIGVCGVVLLRLDSPAVEGFRFFIVGGTLYLLLAWAFSALWQAYPPSRMGLASRIVMSVVLIAMTIMAVVWLYVGWMELRQEPIDANRIGGWKTSLPVWGLASLWVFVLSRWIVWLRLKSMKIQDFQLDFLSCLLLPLLRDLPPEALCTLGCNFFSPSGSEKFSKLRRGSHRLTISEDSWLDFRVRLDAGCSLALLARHRRVDKHKDSRKKLKYKGTKQRMTLICTLQHPALMRMSETDLKRLNQVCERLKAQMGDEFTAVRRDLGEGRVVVVRKHPYSGKRGLEAGDLPDAKVVLKTIRSLTAFVTEISGRPGSALISH